MPQPAHVLPYTLHSGAHTLHLPFTYHSLPPHHPVTLQVTPVNTFQLSHALPIQTAQRKNRLCFFAPWPCPREGLGAGGMMGPLPHPSFTLGRNPAPLRGYSEVKRSKNKRGQFFDMFGFGDMNGVDTYKAGRGVMALPGGHFTQALHTGTLTPTPRKLKRKMEERNETPIQKLRRKIAEAPICPAEHRNLTCPRKECPRGARACRDTSRGAARTSLSAKLSLIALLLAGVAQGSEFPERECCDSVPPPPPSYHQATSTTTTTTPPPLTGHNNNINNNNNSSSSSSSSAINTVSRGMSGVINCIEARHRCRSDGQCRDVLDMLHKICGPELVACATVTPGKCKTLLNTLGRYDYLKSCTCREPHIDFTCYTFREMIFNHPCSLMETNEEHQTYMQTCTDADTDCKNNRACFKNYMEFMNYCGYSGITCTSQQSDKCNESWQRIRTTPRFGCYCPVQERAVGYSGHYDTKMDTKQEKCMNFYNDTHENPCLAGQKDVDRAKMVELSQAMCHVALEHCSRDPECSTELNNINTWCDHSHCEPDRCRNALQEFYQRVKVVRRLQVAFCVCRQSDHDGECLMAMRKLHPTCAERHKPKDPMQCHKIAEQCRQNRACSTKLKQYEQNCAADAITGRCSATHRSCQQAVMNILGTELHATCVCKGTDFLHQHDCYTWQKLLWSNPCVIESHLKLHEQINNGEADDLDEQFRRQTPAPPTSTQAPHFGPTHGYGTVVYHQKGPSLGPQTHDPVEETWGSGRRNGLQVGQTNRGFESRGSLPGYEVAVYKTRGGERHFPEGDPHFGRGRVPTNIWLPRKGDHRGTFGHGYRGTGIPIPSQESHREGPIIEDWSRVLGGHPGVKVPPDFTEERESHTRAPLYPPNRGHFGPRTPPNFMPVTPTPSPHPPTHAAITPSTSTTVTPTTSLIRACSMKDYNLKTVVIPEGTIKRFLKRDSDCSQLCRCPVSERGQEPEANCIALSCVENKTCQTDRALYPHNTPYYLAYRGVCLCYGGKFICQKPEPDKYTLGPGIYLFLAYSRGEVEILEPHTSTNELEAVKVLESVLVRDYGFQCELRTKQHINENFIVVAKLQVNPETYISPFVKQRKEKEICAGPLQEIAKKINSRPRDEDISTDAILSMFILAKVDVNFPEPHTSASFAPTPTRASPWACLVLLCVHVVAKGALLPPTPLT